MNDFKITFPKLKSLSTYQPSSSIHTNHKVKTLNTIGSEQHYTNSQTLQ